MFGFLRRRRRRRLAAQPFPPAWDALVRRHLPFADRYDDDTRAAFRRKLWIFAHEKRFEGVGLEVTDEMRVVVSGQAARLIVHLDDDLYDAIVSVVLRPTSIRRDDARILGLVHRFGTVVLAWDAVEHGLAADDGHDTAVHEFAHAIDLRDGAFDGTPPLPAGPALRAWARVCAPRFLALRADPERNVMRAYGAENEAEFFAVAVETYFEKPGQLRKAAPDLYDLLDAYFGGRLSDDEKA